MSRVHNNKKESRLIDYDFAGEVSKRIYPAGYNADIDGGVRHHDAQAGFALEFAHDYFSMEKIMKYYECPASKKRWSEAISSVCKGKLLEAINIIKKLKSNDKLNSIDSSHSVYPTGSPNLSLPDKKHRNNELKNNKKRKHRNDNLTIPRKKRRM